VRILAAAKPAPAPAKKGWFSEPKKDDKKAPVKKVEKKAAPAPAKKAK